ncbi:LOW QUALITY PROTEIN: hypothetical protein CVT26_008280, partial [Gymnopilus dilepis]
MSAEVGLVKNSDPTRLDMYTADALLVLASCPRNSSSESGLCRYPACSDCYGTTDASHHGSSVPRHLPNVMPRSPSPSYPIVPPHDFENQYQQYPLSSEREHQLSSVRLSPLEALLVAARKEYANFSYHPSVAPPKYATRSYGRNVSPSQGVFYVDRERSYVFITSRGNSSYEGTPPTTSRTEEVAHENKVLLRRTVPDPDVAFPINDPATFKFDMSKEEKFVFTIRPPRQGLKRKRSESDTDSSSQDSLALSVEDHASSTTSTSGSGASSCAIATSEDTSTSKAPKHKRQRTLKMFEKSDRVLRSSRSSTSITWGRTSCQDRATWSIKYNGDLAVIDKMHVKISDPNQRTKTRAQPIQTTAKKYFLLIPPCYELRRACGEQERACGVHDGQEEEEEDGALAYEQVAGAETYERAAVGAYEQAEEEDDAQACDCRRLEPRKVCPGGDESAPDEVQA